MTDLNTKMPFKTGSWGKQAKKRGFNRKKYMREYHNKERKELKEAVFEKLGHKCVWCGFDDKRALQIDHINNDGYEERKSGMGDVVRLKRVLKDTEGRYQILCANCNQIKARGGEACAER